LRSRNSPSNSIKEAKTESSALKSMRKQYEATKVKMQAGIEGASNSEYWSMKPKKMAKKAGKSTSNLKLNKTKANPRKRPSICGSTKCK
jgi:hypothetical protein